jgi:NAD(P)-dependent dehydrogenase (short-subunit alcohol dehydrogenase family)
MKGGGHSYKTAPGPNDALLASKGRHGLRHRLREGDHAIERRIGEIARPTGFAGGTDRGDHRRGKGHRPRHRPPDGRGRDASAAIETEFGVKAIGAALDVAEEGSIVALADAAVGAFGRLDIWVNNAGIFPGGASVDFLASAWDQVQDINLRGTFLGAREAARRMIAQRPKGGVIINVASVSGFRGRPGLAAYVASKHGVVGLTKSLGVELGPHDIRVLGLAPTGIVTPGLAARKIDAQGAELERIRQLEKQIAESLPLGRLGVPDDVARVALFCASDLSLLMTGSTLLVDAGALAN